MEWNLGTLEPVSFGTSSAKGTVPMCLKKSRLGLFWVALWRVCWFRYLWPFHVCKRERSQWKMFWGFGCIHVECITIRTSVPWNEGVSRVKRARLKARARKVASKEYQKSKFSELRRSRIWSFKSFAISVLSSLQRFKSCKVQVKFFQSRFRARSTKLEIETQAFLVLGKSCLVYLNIERICFLLGSWSGLSDKSECDAIFERNAWPDRRSAAFQEQKPRGSWTVGASRDAESHIWHVFLFIFFGKSLETPKKIAHLWQVKVVAVQETATVQPRYFGVLASCLWVTHLV